MLSYGSCNTVMVSNASALQARPESHLVCDIRPVQVWVLVVFPQVGCMVVTVQQRIRLCTQHTYRQLGTLCLIGERDAAQRTDDTALADTCRSAPLLLLVWKHHTLQYCLQHPQTPNAAACCVCHTVLSFEGPVALPVGVSCYCCG
jgi:hypothetical protein